MARYTGAVCRLCRKEGEKLFLKGSRCTTDKCGLTRRPQIPGQHGKGRRSRVSDYAKHLREKQKVKRYYGLLETQFRKYFEIASLKKGITGQLFLESLEMRLDSVVYAVGLSMSRAQGRQLIRQGKFLVNGTKVDIPSYLVKVGDIVSSVDKRNSNKDSDAIPKWILWNASKKEAKVKDNPTKDDIGIEINEQLIVEFYSR